MERTCRRKNKRDWKISICIEKGRKHVGKGENAGYQHFLLFLQCFQKASFPGSLKVRIVWYRVNHFLNKIEILRYFLNLEQHEESSVRWSVNPGAYTKRIIKTLGIFWGVCLKC